MIKDLIQYRSQSLLNLACDYFSLRNKKIIESWWSTQLLQKVIACPGNYNHFEVDGAKSKLTVYGILKVELAI